MKILRGLLIAVAILSLTAVCLADSHPNFSGTWKLNVQKSEMGGSDVTALSVDVNQNDPKFDYTVKGTAGGQDFTETESFTTDGNPSRDSRGAHVKAYWEGATLVIEGTADGGSELYRVHLSMSADGKTATRVIKQVENAAPRTEIYEKE